MSGTRRPSSSTLVFQFLKPVLELVQLVAAALEPHRLGRVG